MRTYFGQKAHKNAHIKNFQKAHKCARYLAKKAHKNVHIKFFKKHKNGVFFGFFKVQDILIVDMKPCFISTKIFLKQTLGYKLIFSSLIKVKNLYFQV